MRATISAAERAAHAVMKWLPAVLAGERSSRDAVIGACREDRIAHELVGEIVQAAKAEDDPSVLLRAIVESNSLRTESAVYWLLESFDVRFERKSASIARSIAEAAVRLLSLVPSPSPDLACRAWKGMANALRLSGECSLASAALENADKAADRTLAPSFNHTVVAFARAAVLYEAGRNDEALLLLDHCAKEFDAVHDPERARDAREFMGSVFYGMGEYETAIAAWEDALRIARDAHDEEHIAILDGNIGHAHARLGHVDLARDFLARAIITYRRLGMDVQRARMLRSLGRLEFQRTGRDTMLCEAEAEFARLSMPAEELRTKAARIIERAVRGDDATMLQVIADCHDLMGEAMRREMDGAVAPLAALLRQVEHGHVSEEAGASLYEEIKITVRDSNILQAAERLM